MEECLVKVCFQVEESLVMVCHLGREVKIFLKVQVRLAEVVLMVEVHSVVEVLCSLGQVAFQVGLAEADYAGQAQEPSMVHPPPTRHRLFHRLRHRMVACGWLVS